jgi:phospholipid/cholesterol/gamma-HCH transport system substrate-binding protein
MQKQAPTLGRILVMAGFALSCFGLLLYLWIAFGGSAPLKPKGYQFHVNFPEAAQLAQQADVRISGVPVGKVVRLELGPGETTNATIQLDERYAPIPRDARAILRQKTLLGETYVELTPGNKADGTLPEGGTLPQAQVADTVELDEIFRSLDEPTRRAFQVWMQASARALEGRGQDISDLFGNLPAFASETNTLLELLDRQSPAVRALIRNTGVVFSALGERQGQLQGLITNSNTVFGTIADKNAALQAAFRAFPTFERESTLTLNRLDRFARDTNPLVTQLRPVANELSPTLQSLDRLAPPFRRFFIDLGPLVSASYRGLPAFSRFLDDLRPTLAQIDPFSRTLNPVLGMIQTYLPDLDAFFGNFAAATAGAAPDSFRYSLNILRGMTPINPEGLTTYPNRLAYNRTNAYRAPGTANELQRGLSNFETRQCVNGLRPVPNLPPNLAEIVGGLAPEAARNIENLAFRVYRDPATGQIVRGSFTDVPAAPCRAQGRFPGFAGDFPRVTAQPPARP